MVRIFPECGYILELEQEPELKSKMKLELKLQVTLGLELKLELKLDLKLKKLATQRVPIVVLELIPSSVTKFWPDIGHEFGSECGPELGPEIGPELGPEFFLTTIVSRFFKVVEKQ